PELYGVQQAGRSTARATVTSEAGQAPQAASTHGFGGKSTGSRAQRASGWMGHHHYFEQRRDEAALRSGRIGACSRDFKPIGVPNYGVSEVSVRREQPEIRAIRSARGHA
ncbi:MAG TPA: hypothetical protein VKP30_01540, partial [Polyangiaceae bacterium]|nr:hypothetical protein [Polyangiaceae bacterium]